MHDPMAVDFAEPVRGERCLDLAERRLRPFAVGDVSEGLL